MRYLFAFVICLQFTNRANAQEVVLISDLSAFKDPGKSWMMAGGVTADLNKPNTFNISQGKGIIVNLSDQKNHGTDLYTNAEYGDVDLEMDYMMASGSNSGIYLQARYEIQLEDTWGSKTTSSGKNGGIYEQWDDKRPEGQKGYGGFAPRQNVSRAPGLWQHLKISFQAPRFDASGKKIASARMLRVELNGVLIHENIELPGPTRGGVQPEKATGPLRIQGDHGAVAFRNIVVTSYDKPRTEKQIPLRPNAVYPIFVDASANPVFRSFMDLPDGPRVVHAVSVGSEEKVHYTYDTDTGMLLQVWRGGYLDATPMWHSRGDGSSRPTGSIQRFGKPAPAVARLASANATWKSDTSGTAFRPKGYVLDINDKPIFKYTIYNTTVTDAVTTLPNGQGIIREINIQKASPDMYVRLAEGSAIIEINKGMYLVGDNAYYLRVDDSVEERAVIRDSNGRKELIVPFRNKVKYSILF